MIWQHFNPRAPCGARPEKQLRRLLLLLFQPTRPLRGATGARRAAAGRTDDFNPRAPCGARLSARRYRANVKHFNPRAPCGARPSEISTGGKAWENFNPRAPCGARPIPTGAKAAQKRISTHAPLAGRDSKSVQITMHIFAITDKFQMLLHRMPPVRAFCSFLMQENHADFGCEPPK